MNKPYSIINGVIMTPEDARDYDFRQIIIIRLSMLFYQNEKQLTYTPEHQMMRLKKIRNQIKELANKYGAEKY